MFDRSLTFLSSGRMTLRGGSHRTSSSTYGFWGPGAGSQAKALSCRHPHVGWFSVGVRRLEEARATRLACRGAHSRLLTRSNLRSPGGLGVRSRSSWLVGRLSNGSLYSGHVGWSVAWRQSHGFVRGHGHRQAWRTTVSPTRWKPLPFRPVHAWPVWCWPACVWSVYGQVAAAAAVWSVRGCPGRLMVGLVCVGFVALLPVVVSPNVVCAAGTSVSALVSSVLVRPCAV